MYQPPLMQRRTGSKASLILFVIKKKRLKKYREKTISRIKLEGLVI
jgi:hypothetical protein